LKSRCTTAHASLHASGGGRRSPVRDHLAAPHRVVQRPGRTQATAKCAARGAQRRRRPSRLKSPRWRSLERSIATCLPPSRAHDRPDRAPHQPQRGDQRWRAWRGRTRGHARMQIGLRARSRQTRVSTPQPRPATRPARDGIASSLRSKPASAVATPAEQAGLGRGYSTAPARCSPSGHAAGEQCSIGSPGTQLG
jgi:hypothetical protein